MKKICVWVCLCILLSTTSAFAAEPFDVHKGGFGPTIKGLQLGMPVTLVNLLPKVTELIPDAVYNINLTGVNDSETERLDVYLKKIDDALVISRIDCDNIRLERRFSKYRVLNELLEALDVAGYSSASICGGSYRDRRFRENQYRSVEIVKKRGATARIAKVELHVSNFEASAMSANEFAKALEKAYKLPAFQETGEFKDLESKDLKEGWCVKVWSGGSGVFNLFTVTIPGQFN